MALQNGVVLSSGTMSGTLGSAAFSSANSYDPAGAAASVQALLAQSSGAIQTQLASKLAAVSPAGTIIACSGDSLTWGYHASSPGVGGTSSYPAILSTLTFCSSKNTTVVNTGSSGAYSSQGAAVYDAYIHQLRPASHGGASNVLEAYYLAWFGSNDWYLDVPAAVFIANMRNLWAKAKADGFVVVAFTVMDRADQGGHNGETLRDAYNKLIKSDTGYDILIDVNQLFPVTTDPNLFYDTPEDAYDYGIHLIDAGYKKLAQHVNQQLILKSPVDGSFGTVASGSSSSGPLTLSGSYSAVFTDGGGNPFALSWMSYFTGVQYAVWLNTGNASDTMSTIYGPVNKYWQVGYWGYGGSAGYFDQALGMQMYQGDYSIFSGLFGSAPMAISGTSGTLMARGLRIAAGINIPATSTSPGLQGQVSYDDNFVYVCTAPNVWKRSAISSW